MAEFIPMFKKISMLLREFHEYIKRLPDLRLISKSGFFDKAWYLVKNPDVVEVSIFPLLHFLRFGGFEGRDPGPFFCSRWYLDYYEDVKRSKLNPLIHYLKYGREKGYSAQSEIMTFVNSVYCQTCDSHITNSFPYRSGKQKVFCIGQNKTGTTSIQAVLGDFGYKVGSQIEGEILVEDWFNRDFRRIIEHCKTADAFQDVPFSLDYTYIVLDHAFPNSKFILTVRNNADEWYESMLRFYGKLMHTKGKPSAEDFRKFTGGGEGWLWRVQQHVYGANETTLLNADLYKSYYTNYNNRVMEYFKSRPKDLLVLNLSDSSAMRLLCNFLGITYIGQTIPHLNKSRS